LPVSRLLLLLILQEFIALQCGGVHCWVRRVRQQEQKQQSQQHAETPRHDGHWLHCDLAL
jgi:hypothetical protein